jgi:PAS domain S-box-containing protein
VQTTKTNGFTVDKLLSSLNEGVFMMDRERRVVLFNAACEHLTGFTAEEVLGTTCDCTEPGECQTAVHAGAASSLCPGFPAFCGECPAGHRKRLRGEDGRWVEASYSLVSSDEGGPCIIGLLRDISEHVAREQEWEQAASALRRELERLRAGSSPEEHAENSNGPDVVQTATAHLDDRLAHVERQAILEALRRAGGQRSRAARLMGISRSRLYRRMGALGIIPSQAV